MATGSAVSSSVNPTGSFDVVNHKTRLIDTGSNIEAATKVGPGQESYATSTTAGKIKGYDYMTDTSGTIWTNKLSNLLWTIKWGSLQPITTAIADNTHGIWCNATVTGTPTLAALSSAEGLCAVYTSGAGAGNQASVNRAQLYTMRQFNPCFKVRWSTDEAGANLRLFMGWTSSTALTGNNDDPLNALSGFGLAIDTTQANYRVFHNDGVGATVSDNTSVAKDTAFHDIELWADDTNSRFLWSLDRSTPTAVTTDIPAATTGLSCQFTITAVNADAKPLSIQRSIITSDK